MTPDPTADPSAAAREMTQLGRAECLSLLAGCRLGRLAVTAGEGAPTIRPVNYLFDEASQSIVFRTAPGSKLHALLRASRAAFEIDEIDSERRCGWSVIVSGRTEEVTDPNELRRLDGLGLDAWAPGERARWCRIRAWTVSGRRIGEAPPPEVPRPDAPETPTT